MFRYEINDGEALIIALDRSDCTHIDIPEFINGYPVTGTQLIIFPGTTSINIPKSVSYIYECCFIYASNLTHINNNKLNDGFNFINDSFIYLAPKSFGAIYKIKFKICDDYVCIFRDTTVNYINDCMCGGKFK